MLLILLLTAPVALAQFVSKCGLTPSYGTPQLASGWNAQLVANGFKRPRSLQFDARGNLLVVDSGAGIYVVKTSLKKDTCCFSLGERKLLINDPSLNHGIALSSDKKTLFASNADTVRSWSLKYSQAGDVSVDAQTTLITGMTNADHVTRTLLIPQKYFGLQMRTADTLLVSRGSNDNFDFGARNVSSGRSMIKAFTVDGKLRNTDYTANGRVIGWGLRNSVGVGEDGLGQIWSVENSADNVVRNGVDIHENNPGEEMNFHGRPEVHLATDKSNHGYPNCLAVWDASKIPGNTNIKTGQQFSANLNVVSDADCNSKYKAPRTTFQAHSAPLDIKFYNKPKCSGGLGCDILSNAFITFHGSWDRGVPSGYKLSMVPYRMLQPVAASDSQKATVDIMWNPAANNCYQMKCFRPVGLAFDDAGNLWMTSDSTGEIFVIRRKTTAASNNGCNPT